MDGPVINLKIFSQAISLNLNHSVVGQRSSIMFWAALVILWAISPSATQSSHVPNQVSKDQISRTKDDYQGDETLWSSRRLLSDSKEATTEFIDESEFKVMSVLGMRIDDYNTNSEDTSTSYPISEESSTQTADDIFTEIFRTNEEDNFKNDNEEQQISVSTKLKISSAESTAPTETTTMSAESTTASNDPRTHSTPTNSSAISNVSSLDNETTESSSLPTEKTTSEESFSTSNPEGNLTTVAEDISTTDQPATEYFTTESFEGTEYSQDQNIEIVGKQNLPFAESSMELKNSGSTGSPYISKILTSFYGYDSFQEVTKNEGSSAVTTTIHEIASTDPTPESTTAESSSVSEIAENQGNTESSVYTSTFLTSDAFESTKINRPTQENSEADEVTSSSSIEPEDDREMITEIDPIDSKVTETLHLSDILKRFSETSPSAATTSIQESTTETTNDSQFSQSTPINDPGTLESTTTGDFQSETENSKYSMWTNISEDKEVYETSPGTTDTEDTREPEVISDSTSSGTTPESNSSVPQATDNPYLTEFFTKFYNTNFVSDKESFADALTKPAESSTESNDVDVSTPEMSFPYSEGTEDSSIPDLFTKFFGISSSEEPNLSQKSTTAKLDSKSDISTFYDSTPVTTESSTASEPYLSTFETETSSTGTNFPNPNIEEEIKDVKPSMLPTKYFGTGSYEIKKLVKPMRDSHIGDVHYTFSTESYTTKPDATTGYLYPTTGRSTSDIEATEKSTVFVPSTTYEDIEMSTFSIKPAIEPVDAKSSSEFVDEDIVEVPDFDDEAQEYSSTVLPVSKTDLVLKSHEPSISESSDTTADALESMLIENSSRPLMESHGQGQRVPVTDRVPTEVPAQFNRTNSSEIVTFFKPTFTASSSFAITTPESPQTPDEALMESKTASAEENEPSFDASQYVSPSSTVEINSAEVTEPSIDSAIADGTAPIHSEPGSTENSKSSLFSTTTEDPSSFHTTAISQPSTEVVSTEGLPTTDSFTTKIYSEILKSTESSQKPTAASFIDDFRSTKSSVEPSKSNLFRTTKHFKDSSTDVPFYTSPYEEHTSDTYFYSSTPTIDISTDEPKPALSEKVPTTDDDFPEATIDLIKIIAQLEALERPEKVSDQRLVPQKVTLNDQAYANFKSSFDRILKYIGEGIFDFQYLLHCTIGLNTFKTRQKRQTSTRRGIAVRITRDDDNFIISLPEVNASLQQIGIAMPMRFLMEAGIKGKCNHTKTEMKDQFVSAIQIGLMQANVLLRDIEEFSVNPNFMPKRDFDSEEPDFDFGKSKILIAEGTDLIMQFDPSSKRVILKPGLMTINLPTPPEKSTFVIHSHSSFSSIRQVSKYVQDGINFIKEKNRHLQPYSFNKMQLQTGAPSTQSTMKPTTIKTVISHLVSNPPKINEATHIAYRTPFLTKHTTTKTTEDPRNPTMAVASSSNTETPSTSTEWYKTSTPTYSTENYADETTIIEIPEMPEDTTTMREIPEISQETTYAPKVTEGTKVTQSPITFNPITHNPGSKLSQMDYLKYIEDYKKYVKRYMDKYNISLATEQTVTSSDSTSSSPSSYSTMTSKLPSTSFPTTVYSTTSSHRPPTTISTESSSETDSQEVQSSFEIQPVLSNSKPSNILYSVVPSQDSQTGTQAHKYVPNIGFPHGRPTPERVSEAHQKHPQQNFPSQQELLQQQIQAGSQSGPSRPTAQLGSQPQHGVQIQQIVPQSNQYLTSHFTNIQNRNKNAEAYYEALKKKHENYIKRYQTLVQSQQKPIAQHVQGTQQYENKLQHKNNIRPIPNVAIQNNVQQTHNFPGILAPQDDFIDTSLFAPQSSAVFPSKPKIPQVFGLQPKVPPVSISPRPMLPTATSKVIPVQTNAPQAQNVPVVQISAASVNHPAPNVQITPVKEPNVQMQHVPLFTSRPQNRPATHSVPPTSRPQNRPPTHNVVRVRLSPLQVALGVIRNAFRGRPGVG